MSDVGGRAIAFGNLRGAIANIRRTSRLSRHIRGQVLMIFYLDATRQTQTRFPCVGGGLSRIRQTALTEPAIKTFLQAHNRGWGLLRKPVSHRLHWFHVVCVWNTRAPPLIANHFHQPLAATHPAPPKLLQQRDNMSCSVRC
jgi:hypothetical protein